MKHKATKVFCLLAMFFSIGITSFCNKKTPSGEVAVSVNSQNAFSLFETEHSEKDMQHFLYSYENSRLRDIALLKLMHRANFLEHIDSINLMHAYIRLAKSYYSEVKIDSALYFVESALTIGKPLNLKPNLAQCYQMLGIIYETKGDFSRQLNYYKLSYTHFEAIGANTSMADLKNNIGVSYLNLGLYNEALVEFNQARSLYNDLGNTIEMAHMAAKMAYAYTKLSDFDKALEYYQLGITLLDSKSDLPCLYRIYCGLENVYRLINQSGFEAVYSAKADSIGRFILDVESRSSNIIAQVRELKEAQRYKEALSLFESYYTLFNSDVPPSKHNSIIQSENFFSVKESVESFQAYKASTDKKIFILMGVIFLILISGGLYLLYLRQNKIKLKQRKMNLQQNFFRSNLSPHFIFNSLSAIQCFILDDKPLEAVAFLGDFAKLMRMVMQCAQQEFIPIKKEMELVEFYLRLQNVRFGNKIKYDICFDENICRETTLVPPLLIQPFIENSIEYGNLANIEDARIRVDYKSANGGVVLSFEDNSSGINYGVCSKEDSTICKAISQTEKRLRLINKDVSFNKVVMFVEDKCYEGKQGNRIQFSIPLTASLN